VLELSVTYGNGQRAGGVRRRTCLESPPKHTPNSDRVSENTMSGTNVLVAAFQKLLPKNLPPGLSTRSANLYQVLSRYAADGTGQRVHQTRWTSKGISDCYWVITRTSLKKGGSHGKAWGRLVWRGQCIDYFIKFVVLAVLTMFTGNREGSKPTRRTHTRRSEVQLEKWGVLCPNDIEYASCTMTTPLPLPAIYAASLYL
jgi:small subunit ribosomal protein S34